MSIVGSLFAALGCPVLPGAKCRGRSRLFDPAHYGELAENVAQRHVQAAMLCAGCPSLDACATWLDSLPPNRRPGGVVAGRVIEPRPARQRMNPGGGG